MDFDFIDDALVPAERWFKQISQVKRAEEKVGVLIKIETFKNEADELTKSFQQLIDVCLQVMNSEKLLDLLVTIREIGNRLNKGYSEAAGFKLDFLPRLARTKLPDKKTTVMDLMVTIFLESNQREALMLSSDFPECQKASRIFLSNLTGDVEGLGSALKKCSQELESLKKDRGQNKVSPTATKAISDDSKCEPAIQSSTRLATSSTPGKPRTDVASPSQALFGRRSDVLAASMKARSEQEYSDSLAPAGTDLLKSARNLRAEASLKDSMEKDGEMDVSPNDDGSRPSDYNLASATKRVEKFLIESESIFADLEAKRDEAIEACNGLSEFFCETGGEQAASTLLGILAEFAGNLDRAVHQHDEQQKIEDRKQKAVLKRKGTGAAQNNEAVGEKKAMPPGKKY